MGWRDFQETAPVEFMENMELMAVDIPLNPLIPLISHTNRTECWVTSVFHPPTVADWRPQFKAWLTSDGELRTIGTCDDLAGEIIKLAYDNLPLQAKLLKRHCGKYSGPPWYAVIGRWRERAKHLFEVEGLGLHGANLKAAEEMGLLAFADELKLKRKDLYEDG